MSIYGHDVGQKNNEEGNQVLRGGVGRHLSAIGKASWVVGGLWNLPQGEFIIDGANCTAAY
eukprot:11863385-Heterocapsa_arctica.AAC.1